MGPTRQTSRGPFFSIGFTHYMTMYLCVIFFLCIFLQISMCGRSCVTYVFIDVQLYRCPFEITVFKKKKMFVAISCILEYLIPAIPIILYNVLYLIMNIIYVVWDLIFLNIYYNIIIIFLAFLSPVFFWRRCRCVINSFLKC